MPGSRRQRNCSRSSAACENPLHQSIVLMCEAARPQQLAVLRNPVVISVRSIHSEEDALSQCACAETTGQAPAGRRVLLFRGRGRSCSGQTTTTTTTLVVPASSVRSSRGMFVFCGR